MDRPIGFEDGDSPETIRRVVEHDRRLACLCPEQFPDLAAEMDCPDPKPTP